MREIRLVGGPKDGDVIEVPEPVMPRLEYRNGDMTRITYICTNIKDSDGHDVFRHEESP